MADEMKFAQLMEIPARDIDGDVMTYSVACVYRLTPPLEGHEYVIASGVRDKWVHEVMLFPADRHGNTTSMGELSCCRDTIIHNDLLESIGYTVVR